jgi:hypothetical protein
VLETLKKHKLLVKLKKFKFSLQSMLYLGYLIGVEELKVDIGRTKALIKCQLLPILLKQGYFWEYTCTLIKI